MFSPKPEEVFEYPREEDYDSDEELTSDEYDEYDDEEEREHDIGRVIEDSDDNNDEVVEKPVEESEDGSSSNPAPFLPFPVFSNLQSSNDPSPQAENPLVKLFSPTMPAMEFESPSDSPVPSPIVTHATPAIVSDSLLSKTHSPPPPAHPNPHKANGAAPPPSHPNGGARTASAPSSIKTDNLNGPPASISPSQISPRGQISPSSSYQALSDETSSERVSVKELRSLWENTPKTTSPPPRVTGK